MDSRSQFPAVRDRGATNPSRNRRRQEPVRNQTVVVLTNKGGRAETVSISMDGHPVQTRFHVVTVSATDPSAKNAAGWEVCLDDLERVHRLKTGALFRSCLMMGYHVAPADRRDATDRPLERLDTYGACFGLAFQPRNQPSYRHSRPGRSALVNTRPITASKPTPSFVAGQA